MFFPGWLRGVNVARPRVFVSSTYYDLKHVRASLGVFIQSLGFESVLSEKGDIAYSYDRPLDESCYSEAGSCDMFVLLIGGRYGAAASDQEQQPLSDDFFRRYESITKREYERAVEMEIPVYILVEKAVFAEYQTYKLNRDGRGVSYAHVDSVNVFSLLDEILSRPRNNPVHTFENVTDIEEWLRGQWAGLLRDLLRRISQQEQLRALSSQICDMRELNETLKKYMEEVIASVVPPDRSSQLIDEEDKRLADKRSMSEASDNKGIQFLSHVMHVKPEDLANVLNVADDLADLLTRLGAIASGDPAMLEQVRGWLSSDTPVMQDFNLVRDILGRPRFPVPNRTDDG